MHLSQLKVQNVKKIAVLRANALGDFIVTLPALQAIKNTYPKAEIVLLAKPWHKEFLVKGRSPVDRVIVVPVKKGIREEKGVVEDERKVAAFIAQMQEEAFDVVMNFQGMGISANPFIKSFNAGLTVGLTTEGAAPLDRSINFYYYQNEMARYLEVAALVGAAPVSLEPQLAVLESDKEEIKSLLLQLQDKPFIALQPFAIDLRRMWPLENYPALADQLIEKGFKVVFTGADNDRQAVDTIILKMKYVAINSCGTFSLGGTAALLQNAAMVIGADTGPLHLARAVNAPSIGMYWAPNLINWGPITHNIHQPLISWKMECPVCGVVPNNPYPFEPRTNCQHEVSFVRDITVAQVLKAADDLWNSLQRTSFLYTTVTS